MMLEVLAYIATVMTLSFGGAFIAAMLYLEWHGDEDEYLH